MTQINTLLEQNQGHGVTSKYTPIRTQGLIDSLVSKGYTVTNQVACKVRKASKEGFQKHMVRLSHNDLVLRNVGDSRPEIVIVNSHDGTSSARFLLGVYRLVCSNGLIVGQTFGGFSVRHVGEIADQVETGLIQIAQQLPQVSDKIQHFNGLILNQSKQRDFANEAAKLILPDSAEAVDLNSVLRTRRQADNNSDLWSVYNKAQETLIRGGVHYMARITDDQNKTITMRPNTTRAIKSIDRQVEVNQACCREACLKSFLAARRVTKWWLRC